MFDIDLDYGTAATRVAVRLNVLNEAGKIIRDIFPRQLPSHVIIVTDETVAGPYGPRLSASLAGLAPVDSFVLKPGEASKSLSVVGDVYRFLAERSIGRDALIVALGGGVVSDLAGFVAATWMRGIAFGVFPTTLEGAIDASIGGKTGVNLPQGKNLVGAFHQPKFVAVDPRCLRTLSARDVRAGLAESVKHALITSGEFLHFHEDHADSILALEPKITSDLIIRNIRIKGEIVQKDAFEQNDQRIFLNFGHTIGHAIESCCKYSLRHGECVALGMLAACRLSIQRAGLDRSVADRVEALLAEFELPTSLADPIDTDLIMASIRNDKKNRSNRRRFVLLQAVGQAVVRGDVDDEMIRSAYESLWQ